MRLKDLCLAGCLAGLSLGCASGCASGTGFMEACAVDDDCDPEFVCVEPLHGWNFCTALCRIDSLDPCGEIGSMTSCVLPGSDVSPYCQASCSRAFGSSPAVCPGATHCDEDALLCVVQPP